LTAAASVDTYSYSNNRKKNSAHKRKPMNVHEKLMKARLELQGKKLSKTGKNSFAGYQYFELGDFLPVVQEIFAGLKLCGIVSYTADLAKLTITCTEGNGTVELTSPMGSAALKGCHEVQNIGAVETYQRRYLWVTAMEIVEHDALDATTGKEQPSSFKPVTKDAWDNLDAEEQKFLQGIADNVRARLEGSGGAVDAVKYLEEQKLDNDEKVAIWSRFSSKERSALKLAGKAAA
jgi:hypothetical protein